MMNSESHYEAHTAESYESAFFYEEGSYTKYLCDHVVGKMHLKGVKPRTLLDVGGGTGNFTRMLTKDAVGIRAIVVDPFMQESSRQEGEELQFVKASAEEFMNEKFDPYDQWWRKGFSQVLMKEVIHHFKDSERTKIFKGMLHGLADSSAKVPSLLIITRPQHDIDYPLWQEAREVWAKNQPHVDEIMKDLIDAGFQNIQYKMEAYPCVISLSRWQTMVKQRFWSTFANFTDSELDKACEVIAESEATRMDSNGCIHFEDRLLFILAFK
jgi:cyclopropane fatty-acyl-phospholipid synthase-like methyltransferase